MTDEGGVLGNLPNERPGRRSAKRDRPANATEEAAVRAEAAGKAAADPARTSRPRSEAAKPRAASSRRRTTAAKGGAPRDGVDVMHDMGAKGRHDPKGTSGDAVGAVVRGAAGLAVAGVKVAGAVTQELFRRLPRP